MAKNGATCSADKDQSVDSEDPANAVCKFSSVVFRSGVAEKATALLSRTRRVQSSGSVVVGFSMTA